MPQIPIHERVLLADKLRTLKRTVAEAVTNEFFRRHPDWLIRYGERGRQKGIEDALYHLDFLAGAVEAGSAASFQDYARWTAGILRARGIAPVFVAENLQQVMETLAPHLSKSEETLLTEFVRLGCEAIEAGPIERKESEEGGLALVRSMFLQALLQGQRKPAANIALEAVDARYSILDIYAEVLQEALYSIGSRWAANEITVAQEHTATAITQYVLALLYERLKPADRQRGKVVITGVEGALHQVGANMVADALEADGWNVRFLGVNMPHEDVLKAVQEHEPDMVGISVTMLFNLPKVRRLVDDIRRSSGKNVRVFVGGGAFRTTPNLYAEIGADGFAPDLRKTVLLLRGLASSR